MPVHTPYMNPMENEMASIQHVSKTENTSWSCFVIVTLGGNSVPKEFSLNHHKDLRDSQKDTLPYVPCNYAIFTDIWLKFIVI